MAVKLTASSFVELIERSGLFKEDQLDGLLKQLEDEGVDLDDPSAIAKALMDKEALTSWQAENLLQGRHKGFVVGPYRFLKMLGKGGMGAVFLAEHQMMRRRCAIKVLPTKHIKNDSSMLERFYLEAQAVAALDDPNIVRAYDVNKEMQGKTEIHYLVMEYVEGQDLQTTVDERGRGLEYVEAADYTRQAAKGLAHAHTSGLIHRDVKPANLLLDKKGVVKILDLGLARFFDDRVEASLTTAYNETTLGTADYLSPEQALNSHDVDTRTDIYSLGCTLYFMLTGQPPFPEGTVAQRLLSHQVKAPTPISKFRPDVPSDLLAIVDRMIAKKPEDRFQTMGELADVLADWLMQHANDEWKEQHPEIKGETAGVGSLSRREPTRSMRSSYEDTEVELGFAPLDDDEPLSGGGSSVIERSEPEPSATTADASDKQKKQVEPEPAVAATSDQLEPLSDLSESGPLDELDLGSLESLPKHDMLGDLPDGSAASASAISGVFSQPFAPSGSGTHQQPSGATFPTAMSGTFQQPAAAPAGAAEGQNKSQLWRILLPVLIGVGVAVPLFVVILIVVFSSSTSTQRPVTANVSPSTTDITTSNPAVSTQTGDATQTDGSAVATTQQQPPQRRAEISTPPQTNPPTPAGIDATQPQDVTPPNVTPPMVEPTITPMPMPTPPGAGNPAATAQPAVQPTPPVANPPVTNPPSVTTPTPLPPETVTQTPTEDKQPDDEPKQKPLTPAELKQLFADVNEVVIKFDSVDRSPRSPLNATIGRLAIETLEDMGLKPIEDENAPAILHLNLTTKEDDGFIAFMLTGEMKCRHESSQVSVWKHEAEIYRLLPRALAGGFSSAYLRRLRENAQKDFYGKLSDDYEAVAGKDNGG